MTTMTFVLTKEEAKFLIYILYGRKARFWFDKDEHNQTHENEYEELSSLIRKLKGQVSDQ